MLAGFDSRSGRLELVGNMTPVLRVEPRQKKKRIMMECLHCTRRTVITYFAYGSANRILLYFTHCKTDVLSSTRSFIEYSSGHQPVDRGLPPRGGAAVLFQGLR